MDRYIRYIAYITNILVLFGALFLATRAYNMEEVLFVLLLCTTPVVSMLALYTGPDLEERKLKRQLNKMQLRIELKSLYTQANAQKSNTA